MAKTNEASPEKGPDRRPSKPTSLQVGQNHLLLIGINDYQHSPKLNNCVSDAENIRDLLWERYHFDEAHTYPLFEKSATRKNILDTLDDLLDKIKKPDNLLILFSGHGELWNDKGFWVPVEGDPKSRSTFISTHDITSRLDHLDSQHTLLLVDACFSGSLFLTKSTAAAAMNFQRPSRWGLSSSHSHEKALDGKPGDHSPFAKCLLEALKNNEEALNMSTLADKVSNAVAERTEKRQSPIFRPLNVKGDEQGGFVFYPKVDLVQKMLDSALVANSIELLEQFEEAHPNHPFVLSGDLDDQIATLKDEELWEKTKTNATKALRSYLRESAKKQYASQVQAALDILLKEEEVVPVISSKPTSKIIQAPTIITQGPDFAAIHRAMNMVEIPGGVFLMGDTFGDGVEWEKPVHEVELSPFAMGKYAVTFEQYDAYCERAGIQMPDDQKWGDGEFLGRERRPIINVSWDDAIAYCNWLSHEYDLEPAYSFSQGQVICDWQASGFRLPSEAEWEYAASMGKGKKSRFGNGKDMAYPGEINFNCNQEYKQAYSQVGVYREKTVPVGSLNSPNGFGLHDMSGNVWEWCWDWFDEKYYNKSPRQNPIGPESGSFRVLRGGSWYVNPQDCRVADRSVNSPDDRSSYVGFRLARTVSL
jgi:formylglycine-generating enzyme required for sulfatase activity